MEFHAEKRGWRRRAVIGFLGLRPALSEHTAREAELLRRYAKGATCVVELGVAEGTSAWEIRQVIALDGALHLVDPHRGRLGLSFAGRVARRLLSGGGPGHVHWWRQLSSEAMRQWRGRIDFLFIDANHSYEAVSLDWHEWTPHVGPGGYVALHDARVVEGGWTTPDTGPVRLVSEIEGDPRWEAVDAADTTVVLRRRQSAP